MEIFGCKAAGWVWSLGWVDGRLRFKSWWMRGLAGATSRAVVWWVVSFLAL